MKNQSGLWQSNRPDQHPHHDTQIEISTAKGDIQTSVQQDSCEQDNDHHHLHGQETQNSSDNDHRHQHVPPINDKEETADLYHQEQDPRGRKHQTEAICFTTSYGNKRTYLSCQTSPNKRCQPKK